ncbi:MAG TPA: PAS domain-containing sensor histidine kinase [Candidatus Sulfotelmatobacter sp.]|jgi:PAS domain S-box-containing protein|nr:PAS domain-containing sensor histidine kinase [Candidatus Sulfotelmatobacter sp.]
MSDQPQDIGQNYQKTVMLFPEAIIVLDGTGTLIRADKQTVRIFGWENEQELIGKKVFDFVVDEDKQIVQAAFEKILLDGSITNVQCTALTKDGSHLRVSASGSLFVDSQGNPKEVICIIHNITLHLSEFEQVKEAERQLSEAQQIAHFGSWEWDIPLNKFQWTDEMFKLFALVPQSMPVNNETLVAHVHEEDKEKVKNFITNSLNNGSDILDFRFVNSGNGTTSWLHSRSKTFYDAAHKPLRMVGTVHDITHEKEIDQVKTQFLSLASHQMRGPLTTINWHAEMLLQQQGEGLSETQKKYINELYNASKRIVQLTNDLLTVSELELGRMPFKPEKLSLPKIAKRVLESFERTIVEKKLNFKEVYSDDLPEIETDLFLLKTIFNELIANAVDYTPPEGTITMSIAVDPQKTNTFLLIITDTGYGIPQVEQEKVFTKMFRASNAKTKVMGGTGLGLYIITLILKLNGGKIWFTSEENKGTTFTVSLPFVPKSLEGAITIGV